MFNYQHKYLTQQPPGYYKALNDFGIIELLQKLATINSHPSDVKDLETLATLLIKHLTVSVHPECFRVYGHSIRDGQGEVVSQFLQHAQQLPLPSDAPAFFLDATPPQFPFGSIVRWTPLEEPELTDWGMVIGRFYGYAPESGRWMWCYLILLDPDSLSSRWCLVDTAWEYDLERFEDE
ncbi:MAG: hypothetical protein WA865_06650 [Spirulinaceae cyanobacterium]